MREVERVGMAGEVGKRESVANGIIRVLLHVCKVIALPTPLA
jgi:hypothetical protein